MGERVAKNMGEWVVKNMGEWVVKNMREWASKNMREKDLSKLVPSEKRKEPRHFLIWICFMTVKKISPPGTAIFHTIPILWTLHT